MSAPTASDDSGFTLIEAMVALVILGIAAVGIVRAAEAHTDTIYGLERRAAAQWVAENALAEAGLNRNAQAASGEREMLGWRWTVRTTAAPSDDPDLDLITVAVSPTGEAGSIVSMRGFLDKGTITP